MTKPRLRPFISQAGTFVALLILALAACGGSSTATGAGAPTGTVSIAPSYHVDPQLLVLQPADVASDYTAKGGPLDRQSHPSWRVGFKRFRGAVEYDTIESGAVVYPAAPIRLDQCRKDFDVGKLYVRVKRDAAVGDESEVWQYAPGGTGVLQPIFMLVWRFANICASIRTDIQNGSVEATLALGALQQQRIRAAVGA